MTYNEAYNKIIEAYLKGEIEPLNPESCFCGTICNNTNAWHFSTRVEHNDSHGYKGDDFVKMEKALLNTVHEHLGTSISGNRCHPLYEDALFAGMCAALDVLKEIHISRGEIIDEGIRFKKRLTKNLTPCS